MKEFYYPYLNKYLKFYEYSIENLEDFWGLQANILPWFKKWDKVLESNGNFYKWFIGGLINASYVCLDQHIINNFNKNKIAYYYENELGETKVVSYYQLYLMVNNLAKKLRDLGVSKGDIVLIYMPLTIEAIVSMLAVARLGAIHNVVFSGFSKNAILDRIIDSKAKYIITTTHTYRKGKIIDLKSNIDFIIKEYTDIKNVLFFKRNIEIKDLDSKYIIIDNLDGYEYVEPVPMESNEPLFVLYTSGTTGKPKGIVHATGGYLVYVANTLKWTFNLSYDSIWWCTADIGWITGHSYLVYAPLILGVSSFIYEGAPDYPDPSKWWALIEKYKITEFFSSPTALRMFMKYPLNYIKKHDLSSLRVLGSVGEPINPEVWTWYFENIGNNLCPIIDTWWQTETGGFMIAPFMGIIPLKPGFASLPLPGILVDVVDENGNSLKPGEKGYLVIKTPWPGLMKTILNNEEMYNNIYWSKFKGYYFPGDYAIKDENGYIQLLGRADEVIKIAGHRIGTFEVESAILENHKVAEAAVIGVPDEIKGEVINAFVVLKQEFSSLKNELFNEIKQTVREVMGPVVVIDKIFIVDKLPKTRSGKIMRRLLKAVVLGKELGDTTTLEDEVSVEEIKNAYEELKRALK
ncbi:MAG: acetate--CoA ligase [bacterium]|jgi:acetyl-CoA synthetase